MDDDDYIGGNAFRRLSVMGNLLKKLTPKEKEDDATFHEIIDSDKLKIHDCFMADPEFAKLVRYKRRLNNKKEKFIMRTNRKKSTLSTIGTKSTIQYMNDMASKKAKLVKPQKMQRNISLPELKRRSTLIDKQLALDLEVINNSNNTNEQTKQTEEKKEILLQHEPWFLKLDLNNPIRKLIDRSLGTERISHNKLSRNILKKAKSSANYNTIDIEKRKGVSIENKGQINDFLSLLKNQVNDTKGTFITSTKSSVQKMDRMKKLLLKCDLEINRGTILDQFIEKNSSKIDAKCKEILTSKRKLNENDDRPLIEEPERQKTKYDIIQEELLQKVKKRIQTKISEELAYKNRGEYLKEIKTSSRINSYELFLKDLNEINEEKERNRLKEDIKMMKIDNLLDDTCKHKEYLKKRIDEQQEIYDMIKAMDSKREYYPLWNEELLKGRTEKKNRGNQKRVLSFDSISRNVFNELRQKYGN